MSVLNNYVVYKNPSDYPKGKFVVRVHEVGPSGVKVRLAAHAVADTLEAARARFRWDFIECRDSQKTIR